MALAKDLMQVGIPAEAATRIGYTIGGVNAAGNNQATAAAIPANATLVTIAAVPASGGVILSSAIELGNDILIVNVTGTNAAALYPPVGGSLNGLGANTAISIPANKAAHVVRASTNAWIVVLSA